MTFHAVNEQQRVDAHEHGIVPCGEAIGNALCRAREVEAQLPRLMCRLADAAEGGGNGGVVELPRQTKGNRQVERPDKHAIHAL